MTENTAREDMLEKLAESFGPEYAEQLLASMETEIRKLLGVFEAAYKAENLEDMHQSSHDLCSVSGTIGFTRLATHAKAVEKACDARDFDAIERHYKALLDVAGQDLP